MRWLFALAALALAAAVAAAVVAVDRQRDVLPDRFRDCAVDAGATVVRGNDTIRRLGSDLQAGAVRASPVRRAGEDQWVLLSAPGYRILVLRDPDNVRFGPDVGRQVFLETDRFAVVAVERGELRVVEDCLALAERET